MRLLRLDLERYGPFSSRSLAFRPDARLHVVYGPNEAGKSCALAAVTDLLFGIEERTRYAFLFEGKDLRLGAEIEGRAGSRLAFRRRKGRKNTLLDANDAALADDALGPYLAGLSRDVFCRAFGLDAAALRAGAEDMLTSGGDVGATLLAAASGMRGVAALRADLEKEADAIYAPRASKDRRFYQAFERYEAARRAIRETELKAGDWKALNARIDELAARREETERRRAGLSREMARLARLKRCRPILERIDRTLEALAPLADLPETAPGLPARLRDALDRMTAARTALEAAEAAEQRAEALRRSIEVPRALLGRAGEIERLFAETGSYAASLRDLPRVRAEADEYAAELADFARRLGLRDTAEMLARAPADAALARIGALAEEGRTAAERAAAAAARLEAERAAHAGLEAERSARGTLIDPRPLEERLAALSPTLGEAARHSELARAVAQERTSLAEAFARLQPSVADPARIAASALPSRETVARFRTRLDALAVERGRAEDRASAAEAEAAETQSRLSTLSATGPIASPEAIAAARAARDRIWAVIRAWVVGGEAPAAGETVTALAEYDRLVGAADGLADRAAADAEQVALHAGETRRLHDAEARLGAARQRAAELRAETDAAEAEWRNVWAPSGLVPLPPQEMAAWLDRLETLLARRDRLREQAAQVERIAAALAGIVPALRKLAADAGLPEYGDVAPETLAQRIEAHLRSLRTTWEEARDLDTRLREAGQRVRHAEAAHDEAVRLHERWLEAWRAALPEIGLAAGAGRVEAAAAMEIWHALPEQARQLENRRRRVDGMERDVHAFDESAAELVAAVGGEGLADLPPAAAAKALGDRLKAGREAETRFAEAERQMRDAGVARQAAALQLGSREQALSDCAAGLPAGADLEILCGRLGERERLRQALAGERALLGEQAEGTSEAELRDALAGWDPDDAEARGRTLAEDHQAVDRALQELFAEHRAALDERNRLEHGVGAEIAHQQRRNAEAELAAAAREWAVLKIASLLVGAAVERHRAGQQDPLMQRAAALFATLTGGAYAGIGQDYDDADEPRLVGIRKSEERVSVPGLSEGTRDQLYLALRLAYLEDYAARAEPAPFVGDDLFATFDEDRTGYAMQALVAIGDRVQPIVFTHHLHVVEIARAAAGDAADIVSLV
ncbi:AAA family ATPase [Faunimonas sp. B44]|uniref:AAA family ATPase n=1 Tax=Faunimonas sp. B44 TaxID=3461493 RepID=UPI004043FE4B